jgi:hypothetical protein
VGWWIFTKEEEEEEEEGLSTDCCCFLLPNLSICRDVDEWKAKVDFQEPLSIE